MGDRLSGDGWPADWSVPAPGWPKGALGGIGASFLETGRENTGSTGASAAPAVPGPWPWPHLPPAPPHRPPAAQAVFKNFTYDCEFSCLPICSPIPPPPLGPRHGLHTLPGTGGGRLPSVLASLHGGKRHQRHRPSRGGGWGSVARRLRELTWPHQSGGRGGEHASTGNSDFWLNLPSSLAPGSLRATHDQVPPRLLSPAPSFPLNPVYLHPACFSFQTHTPPRCRLCRCTVCYFAHHCPEPPWPCLHSPPFIHLVLLQDDTYSTPLTQNELVRMTKSDAREIPPRHKHFEKAVTGQPGWLSGLAPPAAQGVILETRD